MSSSTNPSSATAASKRERNRIIKECLPVSTLPSADTLSVYRDATEAGLTLTLGPSGKLRVVGRCSDEALVDRIVTHASSLCFLISSSLESRTVTSDFPRKTEVVLPRETENWLLRHHPRFRRTVFYDPERHDGSLVGWSQWPAYEGL